MRNQTVWTATDNKLSVARAATHKLLNTTVTHNQDPDESFTEKPLARTELARMGEPITDRRFKGICVQGFTSDYKDTKLLRGTLVNRTYGMHEDLYISPFLQTIFGPINYGPP